ncbi:hypothetical protein AOQ84DRAFT_435166 [Glonium stellatum]|uniref:N-acetyltransferase domain-containing protein n=1 Tax=Glonium stellatum TaxID=574774 RepID=A0A8E2JZW1_9PEZI|nr:hypothetical protein AOQ84DRAFT_435166 [Glonium stellatum]
MDFVVHSSPIRHPRYILLTDAMTPHIAKRIAKHNGCFTTMRDRESEEVVSVAQWAIPAENDPEGAAKMETAQEAEERQELEDEAHRKSLPEKPKKDFIMESTVLENLATNPSYRGQGLASKLIEWPFAKADKNDMLVYFGTALDNPAFLLYKKLGFKEVSRSCVEDPTSYGSEGSHTHVVLIRYPKLLPEPFYVEP